MIGVNPQIYTPDAAPVNKTLLLIGNPADLGVGELVAQVPYFGYLITARDGNIYILAYHEDVLNEAIAVFAQKLESAATNGKIRIPGTYLVSEGTSEAFPVGVVPYLQGGDNATIHDYSNGHQVLALENVEESEFTAYCRKLEAAGYQLYAQNDMNGNLFMTYQKSGGMMLHTYCIGHRKEVRTVIANTELLPFVSNASVNAECTALLHQMQGGDEMGYILRLEDGRFIIVDGGDPTEENALEIYNYLKANAPDAQNIVIAAWYITHAHSDHCGAMTVFAEKYSTDSTITLETVLFNHCETEEQMVYCEPTYRENLEMALSLYYPDVPVYKPLTGQVFTFGKTTIEILYTMADFLPNTIAYEEDGKGGDYNVMSTVCIIDLDSTADREDRLFVMGDTTTVACDEMCDRYGTYMHSDYVQMAHHGLAPIPGGTNNRRYNATMEIYELIDASIALWPASIEKARERKSLEVNQYLLSLVDGVAIAGNGEFTFQIH